MSIFAGVEVGPPMEVFALNQACLKDTNPNKVNLAVGAYRTNEGKPWILPVVKKAEAAIVADGNLNHEYLPVLGMDSVTNAATSLLLGDDAEALKSKRAFGMQCLSGTGAPRVSAEFLARIMKRTTFFYSSPTRENHHKVFVNSGFTEARTYRYRYQERRGIDFEGVVPTDHHQLRSSNEHAIAKQITRCIGLRTAAGEMIPSHAPSLLHIRLVSLLQTREHDTRVSVIAEGMISLVNS